ncbi:MAG: carbohydrate kinase family protein [Anaerolineae bacterium]|nr:carbohydrate kinase family protein [Anaerolineae bacterium]
MREIVITGSIAYDYLMRFPGRFTEYLIPEQLHQVSLSFLVEDMTKHWGGVAANIAYTMALLGTRPKLMGTVGRDFSDYRQWLEQVGVDCSTVREIPEVFTASFFVNTDLDNNQIASFYGGAMSRARDYKLADVYEGTPDLVVISPNDPIAMINLAQECRERGIRFVYDPSQQVPRLDGASLRAGMEGAYLMTVNGYESELICEKTGMKLDDLRREIDVLIITRGRHGSEIYTGGDIVHIPAFPPKAIKDPTGGGDAYRAGLFCGLLYDLPIEIAGQMGSLCATYVLENTGTQSHRFNIDEFITRYRSHFDDASKLDRLKQNANYSG